MYGLCSSAYAALAWHLLWFREVVICTLARMASHSSTVRGSAEQYPEMGWMIE